MIMDMQLAAYLGIVAFFVIMTCVICIIFSQRMKIKNLKIRSAEFEILEATYQNLLLEKAKLEEKCMQQSEIFEKYRELSEKYLNLEKDAIRLTANLEQEKKNMKTNDKWIDLKRFDYVMNSLIREIGAILGGLIKYYAKNNKK